MVMFIFSLSFGLTLNSTKSPIPAPTNSPDIIEPNVIIPSRYNSVMMIDAAQLGISPMTPASMCERIGALDKIPERVSSPMKAIKRLSTKVITIM